jgi:CshA-type fibril repeat protein
MYRQFLDGFKFSTLAVALIFSLQPLHAHAAATWDGEAGDGDWSTPANWEGDLLPNPDAEIILPAAFGAIHVTSTATIDNSLDIGLGTTLVVDAAAVLTVDGTIVGDGDLTNDGLIQQGTNGTGRFGWYSEYFKGYLLNNGTIDSLLIRRFRSPDAVTDNYGTIQYASIELDASGVVLNNYGSIIDSNVEIGTEMFSSTYTLPRFDNLPGGSVNGGTITAGYSDFGSGYKQGALHNQGSIAGAGISVLSEFINQASGVIDLTGGYLQVNCYGFSGGNLLAKNFGTISGGTVGNFCSLWYGEGDGASWSDPLNWSMGIVPSGGSYVKIVMASGETAEIHLDADLTVSRDILLYGPGLTLVIDPGVTLNLDRGYASLGRIVDMRRAAIVNYGTLINHHLFDSGYSNIPTSASTIENNGLLENHGKLNNFEGSVIYNLGTLDSTVGSVENYGSIDNQCGGTVVGTINQNPVDYASCDTTPPVITVPPDITVEATSVAGAVADFSVSAFDETDGAITPSCSSESGDLFALGMTPVTCTAADSAGNAASATFYVTVVDTTPPILTVPGDIIADATSPAGAIVTFAADAADNVGVVSLACAPASGTPFPIGTTVVTCTSADAAGNKATALFNVTVIDVFPPTLTVPADIIADATGPAGAIVSFVADAADNIGVVSLVCAPASGGMFALGTTAVTCTAADAAGNTAAASFSVTIIDTTPPSLTVPADIVADATSPTGAIVTFAADAADNVGVVSLACAPASGTEFPLGATVVTCTAVDAAGNTAAASFNVTVVNVAPMANDDYVETDEDTALIIDVLANDSDGNGDMLTVTSVSSPSHGSAIVNPDGTITYTPEANFYGSDSVMYEVSDGNGGAASATVYITVEAVNDAPQAVDDATSTLEDVPVIIPVLANDSDLDGDAMIVVAANDGVFGTASTDGVTVTYFPAAHAYGTDTLTYQISDGKGGYHEALVTIEVIPVNDPPAAIDDNSMTEEDSAVTVDVLANDSDTEGDPLTVTSVSTPSNGTAAINPDGTITYTPLPNFNGSDSLTYSVSDGNGGAATATVNITVQPVNDAPDVSVDLSSQSVQYSDGIAVVTISATDIDSASLSLTPSGLPAGTAVGAASCAPSGAGTNCSWQLSGYISAGQGTFAPSFTVDDGTDSHSASTTITVLREDATLMLADDNPVAVGVDSPGGDSVSFALSVSGYETQPDTAASGDAEAGDISLADIRITLVPVGPGGSVSPVICVPSTTGSGYAAVTTVTCTFASAPVNTYTVEIRTVDDYFVAAAEDVLTVFDPSLGFTSGGGWFRWPETGDKTNFGYTMKYNKKGAKVQGSLLMIRHLPDGTKYRVKSNSLEGLALGEDKSVPYGWATFSGKSTYLEPGWADAQGNHGFTVYVEDRDEPGNGTDRIWIENRSKDGAPIPAMSLPSAAADHAMQINGGNIVVPHGDRSSGRR